MNFSNLLHWAIVFLLIALVAAVLGFGGVAGTAMGCHHPGRAGVRRQSVPPDVT